MTGDCLVCHPDRLRFSPQYERRAGMCSPRMVWVMSPSCACAFGIVWIQNRKPRRAAGFFCGWWCFVCSTPTMRKIIIHFRTKASYLFLTCCDNSAIDDKDSLPVTILKTLSAWLSSASSLATSESKKGFQLRVQVRTCRSGRCWLITL